MWNEIYNNVIAGFGYVLSRTKMHLIFFPSFSWIRAAWIYGHRSMPRACRSNLHSATYAAPRSHFILPTDTLVHATIGQVHRTLKFLRVFEYVARRCV